jgi:hypothetical protein
MSAPVTAPHAGRLPYCFGLAKDHIQDSPVDRAVRREEQHGAHERARLAEPIDAALALLMAGRIPGQIVMDHRVEQVLQIDAF